MQVLGTGRRKSRAPISTDKSGAETMPTPTRRRRRRHSTRGSGSIRTRDPGRVLIRPIDHRANCRDPCAPDREPVTRADLQALPGPFECSEHCLKIVVSPVRVRVSLTRTPHSSGSTASRHGCRAIERVLIGYQGPVSSESEERKPGADQRSGACLETKVTTIVRPVQNAGRASRQEIKCGPSSSLERYADTWGALRPIDVLDERRHQLTAPIAAADRKTEMARWPSHEWLAAWGRPHPRRSGAGAGRKRRRSSSLASDSAPTRRGTMHRRREAAAAHFGMRSMWGVGGSEHRDRRGGSRSPGEDRRGSAEWRLVEGHAVANGGGDPVLARG